MTDLVTVSKIEKKEELKRYLEELFKQGRYVDMGRAVGMHSILIDPEHTISDQAELYRFVLGLIKERIRSVKGKSYSAWYAEFPKSLDQIVNAKQLVTDAAAAEVLASHRSAFGPFKSLDDFYAWALDDRRLPFDQIVKYIEKTAALSLC